MAFTANENGLMRVFEQFDRETFAKKIGDVLALHGLDANEALHYAAALYAWHDKTKASLSQFSAFTMFGALNSHALCEYDSLNLDPENDDRVIRGVRDVLWQSLTGENPAVSSARQPAAAERLRTLGVR